MLACQDNEGDLTMAQKVHLLLLCDLHETWTDDESGLWLLPRQGPFVLFACCCEVASASATMPH